MPDKIIVVTLNIPKWNKFDELNGIQKIEIIKNHIVNICDELKKSHPESTWIVVWREYGITEGLKERSITSNTKKLLKNEMSELVAKYPNLRIVAGTVATRSEKTLEQTKKYVSQYTNKSIGAILEVQKKKDEYEVSEFYDQISRFKKILEDKDRKIEKNVIVMRNTCYIFEPDRIQRREKNIPYNELDSIVDKNIDKSTVYRIGKEDKSVSPFITIKTLQGNEVILGIEICREHSFGFLINYPKEMSLPDIHFVLSDTIALVSKNFYGSYIIHVDSRFSSKLISPNPSSNKSIFSVDLFSSYLLVRDFKNENKAQLASVPVLYPFECQ